MMGRVEKGEEQRGKEGEREKENQRWGEERSHGSSYLFGRETERKGLRLQAGRKICLSQQWKG